MNIPLEFSPSPLTSSLLHVLLVRKLHSKKIARVPSIDHGPQNSFCFGNPAIPTFWDPCLHAVVRLLGRVVYVTGLQALPHALQRFGTQAWLSPPASLDQAGPPPITAGRRPTITRGLALSVMLVLDFSNILRSNFNAKRDCRPEPLEF